MKRLEALRYRNGNLTAKTEIPEYYNDYLSEKIKQINNLTSNIRGPQEAFIFLTDYHAVQNAGNSPALIRKIIAETGIDMFVFGGDAFQTSTKPELKDDFAKGTESIYRMLAGTTNRFYPLIGNHEWNHRASNMSFEWKVEDTSFQRNSMLDMCILNRSVINEYGDYVIRNEQAKVIHIFIQMDGDHNMQLGQFAWLADVLNHVQEGWGVIVFHHHVYTRGSSANTFESRPRRNARMLSKLLMVYSQRSWRTINNPTGNPDKEDEKQTFDFSNAKGEVICLMGGHLHYDTHRTKEDSPEGILTIVTAGDLCWNGNELYTYTNDWGFTEERTPGTIREQAFDVVQIDRERRIVHCTRIGGGLDREFYY